MVGRPTETADNVGKVFMGKIDGELFPILGQRHRANAGRVRISYLPRNAADLKFCKLFTTFRATSPKRQLFVRSADKSKPPGTVPQLLEGSCQKIPAQ